MFMVLKYSFTFYNHKCSRQNFKNKAIIHSVFMKSKLISILYWAFLLLKSM